MSIPQNCQGHQKQGKSKKLSQSKGIQGVVITKRKDLGKEKDIR